MENPGHDLSGNNPGIYPTVLQAIHLVVLYIFIQTAVDFPLAVIDYYKGTEFLYHPFKKIVLGVGSLLYILYYGVRHTGNPLRVVFPMKHFSLLVFPFLFIFFLGAQPLLNFVNGWVEKLIPPPSWFWELFARIFNNDFGFWGAFMKVVVIAPVTEELVFRGVIMHGLMRNYSVRAAIFWSGLLFALFHLNPWQFPATFVLGILLGWLMIRTKNLGLCIAGHAINNLLVLLSMTFHSPLERLLPAHSGGGVTLLLPFLLVILSVACIHILTRKKEERPLPEKE